MLMNAQPIPAVSERINRVRVLTAQIVDRVISRTRTCWARRANARLTADDVEQAR
jgi:hypothetical protein